MLIQYQKVSFTNLSNEYDSNLNSPRLIKTKINDGPNLYTSFFEQLTISFILNHFNDKVTLYQNLLMKQSNCHLLLRKLH